MTEQQKDEPDIIMASGPDGVEPPVVEKREYANNVEAYDDKAAASIAAQTAPNPTTDVELAKEAYGEDWNKRRGSKIAETRDGDNIYAHGGVAVDDAGHALGHADDPDAAVRTRESLVHSPEATEADRYPVTAEARDSYTEPNDGDLEAR
jgi:hypothetical protein